MEEGGGGGGGAGCRVFLLVNCPWRRVNLISELGSWNVGQSKQHLALIRCSLIFRRSMAILLQVKVRFHQTTFK